LSEPITLGRADGLPEGPRDPVRSTPSRRPGSVRRTTALDQRRGEPGAEQHIVGTGRDLLTRTDGTTEVLDEAQVDATVWLGSITAIETSPLVSALAGLVGDSVSKGLRQRADQLVPEHRERASVLHQLLDDFPMAALISGYGSSRETPDFKLPPEAADKMTDLCAGWEAGGTMLGGLADTGLFPIPLGPPAPAVESADDPLAWHTVPPMVPRSVRRRRRIDVWEDEGQLVVDVHFRDSHLGLEGPEDILHEYTLAVTIDPEALVVRSASAAARVLPWPECPAALGSVDRIVGERLERLRPFVAMKLTGTTTCTHLNDSMRSLAGVQALVAALR
jgi:hypothetical protein